MKVLENLDQHEQRVHNSQSCPYFDGRHKSQQDCVVASKGVIFLVIKQILNSTAKTLLATHIHRSGGQVHALFIVGLPVFQVMSQVFLRKRPFFNRRLQFSSNDMVGAEQHQGP